MHRHQDHGGSAPGLAALEPVNHAVLDLALLDTVMPTSEKAPDTPHVGGPEHTETQNLIFDQPAYAGKRFATLRARLALKGYSLNRTAASDGPMHFNVTRCGLVRELRDFAAVRAFAEQVGVQL